jgi:threonine synthase
VATAIKIGDPASVPRAKRSIDATYGWVTTVSDAQILDAKAAIDASGIGCEPASAASLAGLRRLTSEGVIQPGQTAVALLTGHLLKDTDAVAAYHLDESSEAPARANRPLRVAAELSALERALADALHG